MKATLILIVMFISCSAFCGQKIVLTGTAVTESCPMMLMAADGEFRKNGYEAVFRGWNSPDQYRVMLSKGESAYIGVSMLEYGRLSSKLGGVTAQFVFENAPMWIMSWDENFSAADMSGKTVSLPFRGDMPETLLRMLLSGLGTDINSVKIVSAGGAVPSAQLAITGRADAVMLPEPVASSVSAMSAEKGLKKLRNKISVNDLWNKAYGGRIPLIFSGIIGFGTDRKQDEIFQRLYLKYAGICSDKPDAATKAFIGYFPVLEPETVRSMLKNKSVRAYPALQKNREIKAFMSLMDKFNSDDY